MHVFSFKHRHRPVDRLQICITLHRVVLYPCSTNVLPSHTSAGLQLLTCSVLLPRLILLYLVRTRLSYDMPEF